MNSFIRLNMINANQSLIVQNTPQTPTRLISLLTIIAARLSRAKSNLSPPPNFSALEPGLPGAIVQHYLRDPTFSRFHTIPECDRQTDRQTHDTAMPYNVLASRRTV